MKRLMAIILAIALLTGCSKGVETGPGSNEAEKVLKPFEIIMVIGNREVSLKEKQEGTFDNPFQLDFWFNGKLDVKDKDLEKYLVVSSGTLKPQASIIHSDKIDTTRITAEFNETESLPDEIKITLKAGITDDKGRKLNEDISLSLKRDKQVNAYIRLKNDPTISSDSGFDFNSYTLDNKDKDFEVTFNYPMNRKSVEKAFLDGFRYVPEEFMAKVAIDWKDDSSLTVHFSDMQVGQSYPISFNGAKTATGEEYKEFDMNKVFGFLVQEAQKISKIDAKGNIAGDMPIGDEILELEEVSPDGKYAFGYRVIDNGGDFFPVKPVLLELLDNGVKKHFLRGIDYMKSIIFGCKWRPDGKSFLVYNSKGIWLYTVEEVLQGKPGKLIFEYAADKMDYIVGAEVSPDGNKIAVLKSEYKDFQDKDSKLVDIYYIDLEGKIIETIKDVFYHNSSDGFAIPLKYSWKDNDTIISEGYSQKNDEANIYSISLKEKNTAVIASKASNPSLLNDDIMIIRKVEYDKENGYLAYGDGNIINLKNNNVEDVIQGNLTYSVYGLGRDIIAYELYEDDFATYIYDRAQKKVIKKHQGMIFGADSDYFYILR